VCRWYSALSIIAPSVNVLRRTRRKPSTIRGASPDVVIRQSTAARAGAHPYRAGEVARPYHSYSVYQRFNSNRRPIGKLFRPLLKSWQPLRAATVLNEEKKGAYFRPMIQESTEKIPAPPRMKDSKPAIYNKTTS
jgi:hypothetical protein